MCVYIYILCTYVCMYVISDTHAPVKKKPHNFPSMLLPLILIKLSRTCTHTHTHTHLVCIKWGHLVGNKSLSRRGRGDERVMGMETAKVYYVYL